MNSRERERARKRTPEYLEGEKARRRTPEYLERVRQQRSRPEFLAKKAAYQKEQRRKARVAAAPSPSEREDLATAKRERERSRKRSAAYLARQQEYKASSEVRARDNARRQERWRTDPEFRERWDGQRKARAAMMRGASDVEKFSLDEIFERDRQRCHICQKAVRRADASMDHLIPLSLNGPHTRANVALAHRSCNSRKGIRAIGEQLALF